MCKRVIAILTMMMTLLSNVLTPYSYVMASGTDSSVGGNNNGGTEVVVEDTMPGGNNNGESSSPKKLMSSGGTRGVTQTSYPDEYKITYNNQGADVAGTQYAWYLYRQIKESGIYYWLDEELTQPMDRGYYITIPQKRGFNFIGYFTEPNGGGTKYVDSAGQHVNNIFEAVNYDITLYAYWQQKSNWSEVVCEDWFIDSQGNRVLLLGSSTKYYENGTTANGSDWGTSTAGSTGGPYYEHYRYYSSTSITVQNSTNKVYRYFRSYTNIMLVDPSGVEHWQDTDLGTFDVSYNGGSYYQNVTNEVSEFLKSGELIKIKNISLTDGYYVDSVIANDTRSTCASGEPLQFTNNEYTFSVRTGGGVICIKTKQPGKWKVTYNNQGADNAGTQYSWYLYQTLKQDGIYYWLDEALTQPMNRGWYISIPQKLGYTFGGYYTQENGQGTQYIDPDGQHVNNIWSHINHDITIYAYWIPNTYTVTFNSNGGSSIPSQTITNGNSVPKTTVSESVSLASYVDMMEQLDVVRIPGASSLNIELTYQTESTSYDWICLWGGNHPDYYAKNCTSKIGGTTKTTTNKTISSDTVTIGFRTDGSQHNFYGYSAVISASGYPQPTRANSVFEGWYTNSALTTAYNGGAITANTTLYAKWSCKPGYTPSGNSCVANTYTISYTTNGGTTPSKTTCKPTDSTFTLANSTRANSSFGGWSGGYGYTTIPKGSCIRNLSFTASWSCNAGYKASGNSCIEDTYSISYALNGGSASNNTTCKVSSNFTLKNPTRSNSIFAGWTGSNGTTLQTSVTVSSCISSRSYTANWTCNSHYHSATDGQSCEIDTHTITFNSNGGSSVSSQTVNYGGKATKPTDPTRSNSSFVGWYKESSLTNVFNFSTNTITENTTLYAKWSCNSGYEPSGNSCVKTTYNISYDLGLGTVATANPTIYDVETTTFTLNNPTRVNSTFIGWTGSNGNTPQTSVSITKGSIGNKSYTANWTCNQGYKLSHNGVECISNKIIEIVDGENDTIIQRNKQEFNDLELYFLGNDDTNVPHYTIMDRNLGATESYNQNLTSPNSDSYGYVYQWGNNYGFTTTAITNLVETTTSNRISKTIWSKYIPSEYASNLWYIGGKNWMEGSGTGDGIWGGTGDKENINGSETTENGRRGPCPVGYYIPSVNDWKNIKNAWGSAVITDNDGKQLLSDLLIPAAGYRMVDGHTSSVNNQALYWTSSPDENDANHARYLYVNLGSNSITFNTDGHRANARQVRCVKISPNPKSLTIHANGGTKAVVAFTGTVGSGKFTTLGTPTRAHSKFEGWYSNVGLTNQVITGNTVVSDLYAKWSCDTGYEPSGNSCIPTTYNITYVLDGGTVNGTNPTTYTIESNAITLINPTKTGYTFLGWSGPGISGTSTSVTIPKGSINNRTYTANWQINQYTVTYIDYFADSSNSGRVELGRTTRDINYNTVVNGSDIGSNTAISAYYNNYVYKSSTSATVTTAGATVHRYFWARTDLNIYAPGATTPGGAGAVNLSSDGTSYTQLQDITTSNTQTVKPYGTTYYIKNIVPMNGSYEELDRVENLTKGANDIYTYTPTTAGTSMNIYMRYKTFDIHYELNGGTVSPANPTTYRYDTEDITLNNPTKDYYTFAGWTGTDLSEKTITVTIPTQSYGNRNYTANYTPITYGIQYHLNGGTVSPLNPSSYNIETPTFTLNNPTRNGYTFRGWTGTALSTYTTEVQVTIGSHGPREYWASWNLIPLTITLNLDGGALPANQANPINFNVESDPITLPTPTKQGYTFLGWKLSGINNEPSLEVTVPTGTYESKSYDAVWQINQYTYTLNSAQGVSTEGSTPSGSLDFNTLVTLNGIQNIGYTWLRWQGIPTDLTGDQTQTSTSTNTSFHMPAASATITPVVRPNTATVIYHTNEPAGTKSPVIGEMANQTFTYDEPQSLNENTYQRTGYTYLGWNEDHSATSAQYTDQQTITQLTGADAVQVHLYAIWQQNEYTISYNLNENGATVDNKSNPTLYTVEDLPIVISQPSKVGYHFDGWIAEEDGVPTITTPTKNYTIPSLTTKNITLIAHWTPITYTLHFDNNPGEDNDNPVQGTMANQTLTYDANTPLNPTTISRDGYTFMGWTQSQNGGDTAYQSGEAMPNLTSTQDEVITLYAQWQANTGTRYTVNHYFQNIGRNGYNTPIVENKSGTTYQLTDADPLTNYEGFHVPSKINQRIKGDNSTTINYYYDRIEYNFILDVNGGTPTYSPTTKFYQQTIGTLEETTYVLPTPSRVGYEFGGWRTVKDETNIPAHLPISLKDKEYTGGMMMPANDLHLYADWHPILYTLTLNANGAETIENSNESPTNITLNLEYDEQIDLSDRGRRKQGYTFSGWNTIQGVDQSGLTNGTHYDINQELSNLTTTSGDALTFYAEWSVHHYTIHYHPGFKGEGSMDDQTFTYNETGYLRTLLPTRRDNENNFTRIGYHFTGWSLDPAAAETGNVSIDLQDGAMMYNYTSGDNVEIDLYAVWEPNTDTQYTVYHEFEGLDGEYTTEGNTEHIRVLEGTSDSKVHVQKMNRTGFTFTGEEQEITIDPHGTTTITYQYTRNSYPLTLINGTGVESSNGSGIYKYQEPVTLTSVPQTGYSTSGFTGAYEEDDYSGGVFTMPAKELTLEAIATPHTYTFTFHPGELGAGEEKTQTFTYNQTGFLNLNTYTRTGYHFIGWGETEGLARQKVIKYLDLAKIYNVTSEDGTNYNLYAIWDPNPHTPYTVQYAKEYLDQPGEYYVVQEDTKHLSGETDTQVQAPLITYPGFITPNEVTINIDPDGNKVHTYNYNRKTITINFDTAGGTEVQEITGKYEANLPEVINPIKTGYTFSGWHPQLPATFPAEDETHTGTRTLNTYDIHYDLNQGERAKNEFNELIDNPNTYTFEDDTITLNNPVREGYTFRAWTGYVLVEQVNSDTQESTRIEQPLTPSETMIIPSHSVGEIYFFAEWMANTNTPYTVYHKVQDLDNPEHYTLRDTDNEVGETDTEVTPPVKTYVGFTSPATQTVTILPGGHTEVTYNYTRNAYPITVYSERGVDRIEGLRNTDYKYEEPVNLTPILFPGYTFIEFTGDYDTGTFIMPANQVNLETLVSINTYNITYNYDGGELPYVDGVQLTNPATFTVETEDREIYAPYKTGYTFYGWTGSGIGDEINDIQLGIRLSDGGVQDRSFTAIYTPNTDTLYTVRHNIETLQAGHYENYEEYTANGTTNTLVTPEPIEIDGFGTLAPISTTIKPDGSTVINYNYPRLLYTLTINKDNGDDIIEQSYKYQEPIVYPSYPDQFVKTGHNFLYWDNELSTMPSIDQTSTAIWSRLTYTLSWDVNSGSFIGVDPSEVENGIYAYNVIYEGSIAAPLVERTGYTFNGWQPELPATMPANATGSQAQWLANLYTVTFHANNGEDEYVAGLPTSSAPKVQNFVYDTPQNLLANTYTRVGYGFSGWVNMQNNNQYTNSELVENLTTTSGANINLYAQWKADGFNVTYNPNGAEGETYTEDVNYDDEYTIKPSIFTKTGYHFTHYTTQSNGDGESFDANQNITWNYLMDKTLYAQWEKNNYTITYHANNALPETDDNVPLVRNQTYDITGVIEENPFNKTGYHFVRWDTNPEGTGTSYAVSQEIINLLSEENANLDLYAIWEPNTYTLHFDGNTHTAGTQSDITDIVYDTNITIPQSTFIKEGYTFTGWNTQPDGNGIMYQPSQVTSNLATSGTTTLYAIWQINQYKVIFNTAGGTPIDTITLDYNSVLEEPTRPIKTGHTFNSWQGVTFPYTIPAHDTQVTVFWQINTYNIIYHPNGGTGTNLLTTAIYDQDYYVEGTTFVKTGYSFTHWNTQPDDLGTKYYTGETIHWLFTENKDLYAQWRENSYTLHIKGNNEDNDETTVQLDYEENYTIPAINDANINFHRTGYTFSGWNTEPDGNGIRYAPGDTVNHLSSGNNSDATLYAIWTVNQYTIHFNSAGGTPVADITQDYNTEVTAPEDPIRTGFTFAGWNPNVPATMPAEETTLTAKWTRNSYTISFDTDGGTPIPNITGEYESPVTPPDDPTKTGYTFSGWNKPIPATIPAVAVNIKALWLKNKYQVSYHANNALPETNENTPQVQELYYDNEPVQVLANTFTRNGYTRNSWNTSSDGNGTGYQLTSLLQNLTTESGANINFYAQWTENHYSISYNLNGGSAINPEDYTVTTETFTLTNPTKYGYDFAGWKGTDQSTPTLTLTIPKGSVGDRSYEATWTPHRRTVYYEYSGNLYVKYENRAYDTIIPVPDLHPTVEGYTFSHWDNSLTKMPDNDLHINSIWTTNTHNVSYNDGETVLATKTDIEYGTDLADLSTDVSIPTKEGYTFSHWIYPNPTMPDEDIIIQASRNINHHTVYYKYGDILIDTITDVAYHSPIPPTSNEPTRHGYTFSGWNYEYEVMPDHDITVQPLWRINKRSAIYMGYNEVFQTIPDIEYNAQVPVPTTIPTRAGYDFSGWTIEYTQMPDNDITIQPQWKIHKRKVTYMGDNQVHEVIENVEYDAPIPDSQSTPTKEGYTFSSWNISLTHMPDNDVVIEPRWSINYHTVYYKYGDTIIDTIPHVAYHSPIPTTTNEPSRVGYDFSGWNYEYEIMPDSDIIIQPLWNIHKRRATYMGENGIYAVIEDIPYSGSIPTPHTNPTKTGYTFSGWINPYTQMPDNNITITPTWKANTYEIAYNSNGGEGTMPVEQAVYDISQTLTGNAFTREGYTFSGWNMSSVGQGTGYEDEAEVMNLSATSGAKVILYAQWSPNSYEIKWMDGEQELTGLILKCGHALPNFTAGDLGATKAGYEFNGWSPNLTIVPPHDAVLQIQWKEKKNDTPSGGSNGSSSSSSSSGPSSSSNTNHNNSMNNNSNTNSHSSAGATGSVNTGSVTLKSLRDRIRNGETQNHKSAEEKTTTRETTKVNTPGLIYSGGEVRVTERYGKIILTRGRTAVLVDALTTVYPELIENKPIINENCREFEDLRSFSKKEADSIEKLCKLGIMGVHNSDKTPIPVFNVDRVVRENEFYLVMQRLLSGGYEYLMTQEIRDLEGRTEDLKFEVLFNSFMRIKAEISKQEEEHGSPVEKQDQNRSRRVEEEDHPEKLKEEDDDEDENEGNNEGNNNEANDEKEKKPTLKSIKDSIIKK